jgi:uncharacterized protein (DUF1810 family)
MSDPFDLDRFVRAQAPIYPQVRDELRRGRKTSHWMWFVFPQIQGLGRSQMAQQFAIGSLEEARAYLAHPLLGPRLIECTGLVCAVCGKTIHEIFGSPDDLKFHSSMTLFFHVASDKSVFEGALRKYFAGKEDEATLQICGLK